MTHRDLKTSNILLSRDGHTAKIGDVGLSRSTLTDLQSSLATVGTPIDMSRSLCRTLWATMYLASRALCLFSCACNVCGQVRPVTPLLQHSIHTLMLAMQTVQCCITIFDRHAKG